jgi:hypothetical protein
MKQNIYDILKGKFLINDDAIKNWRFIVFAEKVAETGLKPSEDPPKKIRVKSQQ